MIIFNIGIDWKIIERSKWKIGEMYFCILWVWDYEGSGGGR